jgi:hypothetical protein
MNYRWHYFAAAILLACYLLVSGGVPLFPVALGCLLAAVLTWRKISQQSKPF